MKEFKKLTKYTYNKMKDGNVNWWKISKNYVLSENIIREFQDKWDWGYICQYQKLSEDFIREFQARIDFYGISCSQELSESFIREFMDKLWVNAIFEHQYLSYEFICEFINIINIENLLSYNDKIKLTEDQINSLKIIKTLIT